MEKRRCGVFGDYCRSRCRHRHRKKGINFRVIKVNLSFGELKIFQMVQNYNRIQLISYNLIVWKKNLKKVKGGGYRKEKTKKQQKILSDIDFPRTSTTLPFKNLTLSKISSKKSPQMPPNPLTGGLVYAVWKCAKSQFLESSNILY